MRLPSLFALRALEAAVRHGGYSAAARELSVTQGAVSQQIRKLEAELGASLFHRRGNEMVPTPEAARLAGEIATAVAGLQGAVEGFAAAAEREPLVLSVDGRFAARWLAPKLPRLLAHPAGANLDIRVEDRVANFTADGIDLGVRFGRGDWPLLAAERLTTDRFYVVCTPQFAAEHRIATARDLLEAPLIHSADRPWSMLFDRLQLPTPPVNGPVSNDSLLVLEAVARGVGAAIVRSSMVDDDLASGRLMRPNSDSLPLPLDYVRPGQLVRPVADPETLPAPYGYFAVWRPDNRKQRRIRLLCDWLTAAGK
ncbi:LysR substrate-binding domain-containing protein [Phenylobacterium sp.]|jgi:LysR family glycine cleavage system transcriptional activator|uniref:LysR substrate-binding domain-containing protein n=1 Tax=Phenylobacterium sp. TaxID=1871053 RepID=UPI002F407EF2